MYRRTPHWLFSLFFLLPYFAQAAAPTAPSTNFNVFLTEGNRIGFNFTKGDGVRRIVVVREGSPVSNVPGDGVDYNHDQDFGGGDELSLGDGEFVVYDGTGASGYVLDLAPGTTYYFSIFEYNGSGAGTEYLLTPLNGSETTLSAPTVQASGLNFSNATGSSLDLNWTRGDGDNCLVLIRAGGPVNANPTDLAQYISNPSLGNGSRIGTDNYVIYKGTGTAVTALNLQPGTTYHFAIFEFNGSAGPVYLLPGHTGSATTATYPTDPGSGLSFLSNEGYSIQGNWTRGNGARRIVVVKQGSAVTGAPTDGVSYSASSTFGSGDQLAPDEYIVYNSSGSSFFVQGLQPNTEYYFKIFEYNGTAGNNTYYLTAAAISGNFTSLGPPSMGVQNISFSNITGSSMTISWDNGDGTRRVVLGREGSPVDHTPADLEYFATSNPNFELAPTIGTDNKVLYRGSGNTFTVSGLNPGVTYHFIIFEYNGSNGPVYYQPGTADSQMTDNSPPAAPATNLSTNNHEGNRFNLNWTNGDGARRIVVMREGSDVTAVPVNGMDYDYDRAFGSGDDLGSGEYVVYDGAGSSVQITNLEHSTTYYFRVYEYFGTGTYTIYQTSTFGSLTQSTITRPTTSASVSFSSITGNSMQVDFSGGDGDRRLVICRADVPVDAGPTDYTYYTSYSTTFGNSSYQLDAGQYIVYRGTATSINLTGLSPGVTYYFKVFEYNGNGAPVYELGPPDFSQTTPTVAPTIPSQNVSFTQIGAQQMNLSWIKGNGTRRLVLAKAGAPVDAAPVDDISYIADNTFGDGDELGTGNFVVFDGTGASMLLQGLSTGTTYHLAIFEYNSNGVKVLYLTPGTTASQATSAPPTVPASNLTTSDNSATSVQLGWTVGNGDRRMVIVSEGAPFNSAPTDGTSYTYTSNFSSVNAQPIGNGKVVYLGTGTSVSISGLQSGTTYYFYVFEFNGLNNSPAFHSTAGTTMHTTQGPPQMAASTLNTTDLDANTVSISWTPGSGQKRLVVMRADGAAAATPTDGNDYTPNSAFGSGDDLGGGNFVVYEGNGDNAVITGLAPSTIYHLSIYEFNFESSSTRYLLAGAATLTFSTTALPVECVQFDAEEIAAGILLNWQTATEKNNEGFSLQKSEDGIHFQEIAWIPGNGTTDVAQHYHWTDEAVQPGQPYYYRLIQQDWDGQQEQACSVISVQATGAEGYLRIAPNPFHEQTNIQLQLEKRAKVTMEVFTLHGQRVTTIRSGNMEAGPHQISWQAIGQAQDRLAPGIYLLRVQVGDRVRVRRLSIQ